MGRKKMKIINALLCALATANPVQLYERVSEGEALSRNARHYPYYSEYSDYSDYSDYYSDYPQGYPPMVLAPMAPVPRAGCEQRCQGSVFAGQVCDWWCPRM